MGYLSTHYNFKNSFDFTGYDKKLASAFPDESIEFAVRFENLRLLCTVLVDAGIPYWLLGKTLLGIVRDNKFIRLDHDDDIGIDMSHIQQIPVIYEELKKHGFDVIRITDNDSMFSVFRKNRYIDICIFSDKPGGHMYGYEQKKYPKKYFDILDSIVIDSYIYSIPCKSKELLGIMYPVKTYNDI
jgi:hypothetical protein